MKKLYYFFISFFIVTQAYASPELIRINKNSVYRMIVNYQICFRNLNSLCYPIIKNISFNSSRNYRDIKVDNAAMYVRVVSAYTFDAEGLPRGQGEFGEEDCKVFNSHPVTLDDKQDSNKIACLR